MNYQIQKPNLLDFIENHSTLYQEEINEYNYNWPPMINIIHYDPIQLKGAKAFLTQQMDYSFRILFTALLISIINAILQMILYSQSAIRILYSVYNCILFSALGIVNFDEQFSEITRKKNNQLIRRITILSFNLILHILFMVVDAGGINGVLRAIDFLEKKYTISAYLAFIEIFLHSANIIVISHYLITKNYLLKQEQIIEI